MLVSPGALKAKMLDNTLPGVWDTVCQVLSFDDYEAAEHMNLRAAKSESDFNPATWKEARGSAIDRVEAHLQAASAQSGAYHLIIVDDNMYYRSMRYSCVQLARKHQAAYIQLYIRVPLRVALQRNALRPLPHRVPDSVMHRMASLLEQPNADKHAWEANTIVLESACWENNSCVEVCQQILTRWQGPAVPPVDPAEAEQARQASQDATQASLVHQLDLFCRKEVSHAMQQLMSHQAMTKQQMADTAQHLNAQKQAALSALKAATAPQLQSVYKQQQEAFRHATAQTVTKKV